MLANNSHPINFTRMFRHLAEQHGDAPALINTERGRRLSFRELHALSNRIANMMRTGLGLDAGDRYMLVLENDNLSLMHLWTIYKCHAAAVFTNVRDPLDEHLRLVDYVTPKCVFIEGAMAARYAEPLAARGVKMVVFDMPEQALPGALDFQRLLEQADDADPDVEFDRHGHVPVYRFTGGTTGTPKCAAYSYDNMDYIGDSFRALEDQMFTRATRTLHFAPLSHAAMMLLMPTFAAGGCNLTQNQADVELWRQIVQHHGVTTSFLVPTLLYRLAALQQTNPRDLGTLQSILYGAAPMSPDKLVELQQVFGDIFIQAYAATEAVGVVSALPKRLHRSGTPAEREVLLSAGLPVAGAEVRIAADDGTDVAPGAAGEIWIRHRGVIAGYYGNPEQSAREFSNGWWRSGDIGRIGAGGLLYLIDRKKDMIISGGFNIYAAEVEAALASHPAVLMAAVVGIPDAEWGEAVHAEVVLKAGAQADMAILAAHVKAALGGIKTPKSFAFVDALPMSAVGKVLRRKVQEKYWDGRDRRIG